MKSPAIPPRDTVIKQQQYLMAVSLILGLGRHNMLVSINTGQALLEVEKVVHK